MYLESVELVRELVNNAYDADASEVYIHITPESLVVEDNGSGMNEKGLAQFFTVGSKEKRVRSVSPIFGRKRIGQFGIGKFAALSVADQFIVESKKGNWLYNVIFDREEWEKDEKWEVPIKKEPATTLHHEGTKVTLLKLKKHFTPAEVEKYLRQAIPLRAKKFAVLLNGKRITAKIIPGARTPINLKTIYGTMGGEIIIALNFKDVEEPGIECRVKGALVKRELFGLEKSHTYGLNRICGEINADFLPITATRTDFIRDSPEYQLFYQILRKILTSVLDRLKQETERKNLQKISSELRGVLNQIRDALKKNPDLTPSGNVVARRKKARQKTLAASAIIGPKIPRQEGVESEKLEKQAGGEKKEETKVLREKPIVIRRIRIKKLGVSVGIVPLGEEGPETAREENQIYINQDHPLYKKFYNEKDKNLFSLHLLRLITQEIVLMKKSRLAASDAFEMQSKLLKDALVH